MWRLLIFSDSFYSEWKDEDKRPTSINCPIFSDNDTEAYSVQLTLDIKTVLKISIFLNAIQSCYVSLYKQPSLL